MEISVVYVTREGQFTKLLRYVVLTDTRSSV